MPVFSYPLGPMTISGFVLCLPRYIVKEWISLCGLGLKSKERATGDPHSSIVSLLHKRHTLPDRLVSLFKGFTAG